MKPGIHPQYKEVIFFDTAADFKFLTRSTMEIKGTEKMKWTDGNEYPLVKIEVSSESHPFYTGKHKIMDTAGRVEKFRQRYARKTSVEAAPAVEGAEAPAAKKAAKTAK